MNKTLLSDTLVKEETKKEIKDFLEFNENEGTSYQNLWNTMEAVLRGKLIALSASKKRMLQNKHVTIHPAPEAQEGGGLK